MITLDANQERIVEAGNFSIDWLFYVVDASSTEYYWSTKTIEVEGTPYTFKILDFAGIKARRSPSEVGVHAPNTTEFTVSNADNTLTASDFVGGSVEITLRATDASGTEDIATWKFDIRKVEPAYQELVFTCEDFLQKYLRGDYPNTRLISALRLSNGEPASGVEDNLCAGVPIGKPYPPIRSVYTENWGKRYYVLGEEYEAGTGYRITKVHSPHAWGGQTEWSWPEYNMHQTNSVAEGDDDTEGDNWELLEPIIADTNNDGTPDAGGVWLQGDTFLDMPVQYGRGDTEYLGGKTGEHTHNDNVNYVTDSSKPFLNNHGVYVDLYAANLLKGSWGKINRNNDWTLYNTLQDGLKWDNGDEYYVLGCASVIKWVLMDMGLSDADFDDTSFGEAELQYGYWDLKWVGAFHYKEPREEVLLRLLNMCASQIVVRDKIYLYPFSKASVKTLDKTNIRKLRDVGTGSFTYRRTVTDKPLSNAGYAVWNKVGEPQDRFLKTMVPVGGPLGSTNYPSQDTLFLPFVQNAVHVQQLTAMWLQRKYYPNGSVSFGAMPNTIMLEPDDIITIDHADYGGNYKVMVDSVTISKDLNIQVTCATFATDLDDLDDLGFSDIDINADPTQASATWQPVISGPYSPQTGDLIPNAVRGMLRLGTDADYILLDPSEPVIKMDEDGTDRILLGKLDTDEYGLRGNDASGTLVFKIDTSGALIAGWVFDEYTLTCQSGEVGLNAEATGGTDWRFWAGHATPGSAPFRVDESGNLVASSATITGTITASSGTIGGFTISATQLYSGTNIILDSSAKAIYIKDSTFGNDGLQFEYNAGNPRFYVGDGSTKYFKFDGTDVEFGGGIASEVIFQAYTSGIFRTNADVASNGGLEIDKDRLIAYDDSGTPVKVLEFRYGTSGIGDAYIGTYDVPGHGLKYTNSTGVLEFRGRLVDRTLWIDKAVNFTAVAGEKYRVDTSGASRTMTLPASASENDKIQWVDVAVKFGTNKFSIARNGHKIHGFTEDLDCDRDNDNGMLLYTGATYGWELI